jgi:hypothetical protein
MGQWGEAFLFGLIVVSFVLGISNIIMAMLPQPASANAMRNKVEYGFFGVSALVLFAVFFYALQIS